MAIQKNLKSYSTKDITPTIIGGPTPYAIKMDSSQIGCQNL